MNLAIEVKLDDGFYFFVGVSNPKRSSKATNSGDELTATVVSCIKHRLRFMALRSPEARMSQTGDVDQCENTSGKSRSHGKKTRGKESYGKLAHEIFNYRKFVTVYRKKIRRAENSI